MTRILVTGASGMLGRAVFSLLQASFHVEGWAFSRFNGGKYKKVDLTDKAEVKVKFNEFKPNIVIHCAAERRPDKVSSDPEEAEKLNRNAAQNLAEITANYSDKNLFIYMSTDYVFDGISPPYDESATPHPLNEYGKQKLAGETACTSSIKTPQLAILRVPILYGKVEYVGEGAVDAILQIVLDKSGKIVKVDDYQKRYPTHVEDVARVLKFMVEKYIEKPGSISGIYHWSGTELFTKYKIAQLMGEVFSIPTNQLQPDSEPPKPGAVVLRPADAQLTCDRLISLGVEKNCWTFREAVKECFGMYIVT